MIIANGNNYRLHPGAETIHLPILVIHQLATTREKCGVAE